jgi:hypothetical protein
MPAALLIALAASPAHGERLDNPLRFFEGLTESVGTMNVLTKNPVRMRSVGRGAIQSDGSLVLVQRVEEQGKAKPDRRWHIRQVAPGRFLGTMSEAKGPVTIEKMGARYRFRFRMKGNLSAEQWLIPLPDGKSAISRLIVRKLGFPVARSEGTIRKIK